ncbi:MAG: SSU ribosomal protein S10p (S20e) [uncultured Campylobacterales bacterium]|uniref:Small ribosomal subunit protein uS10 n=1 Tax=uncultured Campylobacterales bacterium TaxID=352960 RepID=A0A6S6SID0_9BACT|nr:MAG: SSU ribosomal protein S10p (S20e) [uncultured Campylobacterales bacterium]
MEKLRLKLKAYDAKVLDKTVVAIVDAAKRTGAEIKGPIPLPTSIKKYTVLRSPHVNKDSREQFEIRIHSRLIDIISATGDTVDSLVKLDIAPEINVEITKMSK